MSRPQIEVTPARPAVGRDAEVTLDVLVRITPPLPEVHFPRPPLNLALVLDRSGSMEGQKKMPYAREAAAFAVQQLLPEDRVSVTTFDDRVETLVPNGPAADKPGIVRRIGDIRPRGSTNLHGGWAEGARQAELGLVPGGLNRVLLLSDGLANVGVTDPNTIAAEAAGLAARGVSTTTLGVGDDYNEALMEAIARAGDGNYYYIESPVQLVDIFQTELTGLMATLGRKVSLGIEPREGVRVADVLNDFDRAPTGRLMLPNLIVGMPALVLVRLTVPPAPAAGPLCRFRLAWDGAEGEGRQIQWATLDPLPVVPQAEWAELPVDPAVREQEGLLMAARAQREAARALERGDLAEARQCVGRARLLATALPATTATADELRAIAVVESALDAGDVRKAGKQARFNAYVQERSRPRPPEPPKGQA